MTRAVDFLWENMIHTGDLALLTFSALQPPQLPWGLGSLKIPQKTIPMCPGASWSCCDPPSSLTKWLGNIRSQAACLSFRARNQNVSSKWITVLIHLKIWNSLGFVMFKLLSELQPSPAQTPVSNCQFQACEYCSFSHQCVPRRTLSSIQEIPWFHKPTLHEDCK